MPTKSKSKRTRSTKRHSQTSTSDAGQMPDQFARPTTPEDDLPRTFQQLVNMLLNEGVTLPELISSPNPARPWKKDEKCPVCHQDFTDKVYMVPCGHVCDFECFLTWLEPLFSSMLPDEETLLEAELPNILDLNWWDETMQLVSCPVCKGPTEMSAPGSKYLIPAQGIYYAAKLRYDLQNKQPLASQTCNTLEFVMLFCGWRLVFESPNYKSYGYWTAQIQDLIAYGRAHGFSSDPSSEDAEPNTGTITSWRRSWYHSRFVDRSSEGISILMNNSAMNTLLSHATVQVHRRWTNTGEICGRGLRN